MQLARNLARPVFTSLPPTAQWAIRRTAYWSTELVLWPFRSELNHEFQRVEWCKRERNIRELLSFPEMEKSAWKDLGSLGYEIIRHYRPKVVVELGTHVGLSALAMGLALRDLNDGGKLFAVDTWQGDQHSGRYSEDVYRTFLDRRARLGLDAVIVPMRMTFDEAREKVPDKIDLLHVDGLHTWDAVNHDFGTYRPFVRSGGLVLFHDVNTCYEDMRRFWKEISGRYTSHLIPYSNGLGIIRVGGDRGDLKGSDTMSEGSILM
jgi:predicted O-methyltransferase YrrM